MAHFIRLYENATAKEVAHTFLPGIWTLPELPTVIISDMDAKLSGPFWQLMCKMLGVERCMSMAYQPQPDGQTERTKQMLEGYLRTFVNYDQNDRYQLLPLAKHASNNSATNAHKMTRLFANYSFHPQTEWMKEREAHNPGATMYAHGMQDIHQQVKQTLETKDTRIDEKYYDRKAARELDIEIGDLVMLNATNICTKRPSNKLSTKLYAPFKVQERKGHWSYKIEISPSWKILPVFHVFLFEPYPSSHRQACEQPL